MHSQQNQPGHRQTYMDFLRIAAIFLVLFNHTNTRGYALCIDATHSVLLPLYLLCAAFCKVAVPVFLMISGALLLKKDEPLSVLLKKRFLRFFFTLFSASSVIYVYLACQFGTEISLPGFLLEFYSTNITTSLWYLYAYLAFLLTLPFLRRISRNAESKDYLLLTGLMALNGILHTLELLIFDYEIQINGHFSLFTVDQIVYYPLMGDYLANKLPNSRLTIKNVGLLSLIGFAGLAVNCLLTVHWCGILGQWEYQTFERHIARFVFLPTISVFVGARYLFSRIRLKERTTRVIAYIGSCTFGIYLFERIYRRETLFVYTALEPHLPHLIACLVWIGAAFLLGMAVTSVLKKIPILRKYI